MITIEEVRRKASARAYMWEVNIIRPILGVMRDINLRCTTLEPPKPTIEKIETLIRGFTIPEAGGLTWNELSFTCVETVSFSIYKALWACVLATSEPITGIQLEGMVSPHSTGDITIHMQNLLKVPSFNWVVNGAILTGEVGFASLSSDKTAVHELTFTVSYAYAMVV